MSLLREVKANYGGFSNVLNAAYFEALSAQTGDLGAGVITIPEDFAFAAPVPAGVTTFLGLSNFPYTVQWDPKTLYVGRIVMGAQMGAGSIAFGGVAGSTVTVYNAFGAVIPNGSVALVRGSFGAIVCTEKTETTATLRFFLGTPGAPALINIPAAQVAPVTYTAGASDVISYATGAVNLVFAAAALAVGQKISITVIGTGTLSLTVAVGSTVTFLDATGTPFSPSVTTGNTSTFIVTAATATTATLQLQA
jgi:hypothetical protein